jgi:hypothetical protein
MVVDADAGTLSTRHDEKRPDRTPAGALPAGRVTSGVVGRGGVEPPTFHFSGVRETF